MTKAGNANKSVNSYKNIIQFYRNGMKIWEKETKNIINE